ncbi:unnamed protein product [Cyclocybe aegerita]|uniref:THUMP domain-containing protein n=1 Tax=Cyclocybe aegerita TaxID=1973307 RepID=A0A8S0WZG4_CYCAE|nr:unnamed protein product [Cyclocybe aegerita]
MSEGKRKFQGDDKKRKKKYRSDGTPIWGKRHVEGPGVWVSCVKGKEKQTVGEIYELFESVAAELWAKSEDKGVASHDSDAENEDANLSLEDQIANEISAMKRPRTHPEQRFANCQTNTPCVVFISCKPPVNPVDLVVKCIRNIEETGVTRTRYVHRLVPVSGTCVANLPEIQSLCQRVFGDFFDQHPDTKFKYKIELRVRNHTTIDRSTLIQHVAQSVPEGHTVDLENPKLFILVEVFKSICGISIVEDYYRLHKFNVMEIANGSKKPDAVAESRVGPATGKEEAGKGKTT